MTAGWRKDIASWRIGKHLYLSVPFTWLLPQAHKVAEAYTTGPVHAGGPAVSLMPDYLADVAEVGGVSPIPPLSVHNPLATFTTRGCPNACKFCAVPRIEGDLVELAEWEPRPLVCDNNLLAASKRHFDRVIDRLKSLPFVDFNQGLDCRLFRPHHARRLGELKEAKIRFAFDSLEQESRLKGALDLARLHGLKDFGVYVLIGFGDTQEEALYRLEKVREWGVRPNPMRYQPLDCIKKNSHPLPTGWTEYEMLRTMQYFGRLRWLEHIPFSEYQYHAGESGQADLFGKEAA